MFLLFLAFLCAILIGLSLGIIGAGGAILTIPVFVYVLKVNGLDAITCSLFVVCLTSFTTAIQYFRMKQIHVRAIISFGIPSLISVWIFRGFVLPAIPDRLFTLNDYIISKSGGLLIVFALLMFVVAFKMLSKNVVEHKATDKHLNQNLSFVLNGLFVGAITGLLGAGGGFLIVPALVLLLDLEFKIAVGSSLCIIFLNTAMGLMAKTELLYHLDWKLLSTFTFITVSSSLYGTQIAHQFSSEKLKRLFGFVLIFVACFMLYEEVLHILLK
ncbi:MAG: sulfite exporter TauE/SafE family protein [Saprospiraceae bacterium]|nr:sulfite exporter TauE/SafE family protein [Saprospiraceae bacterium]